MTTTLDQILTHKQRVDAHLTDFLRAKKTTLSKVNHWGADIMNRLAAFVVSGKTIRGSLAVYTYALFQNKYPAFLYEASSALELFQAGFLIHDDIMDRDTLRRGKASIHEQYTMLERERKGEDADHFGISMGINAADLCFFLGYELLCALPHADSLYQIIGKEMQLVVVAQMQDVESNARSNTLTAESVLSLYRYKTARYTFSLPMTIGAILAQANADIIMRLDRLGESMGLLFQIRDDELSIQGDSAITGKPVGSDEKNAKQTLATLLTGEEINELKSSLLEHSEQEIDSLPIPKAKKTELTALLKYCLTRNL